MMVIGLKVIMVKVVGVTYYDENGNEIGHTSVGKV